MENRTVMWDGRWSTGKTGWHKKETNIWLIKYGSLLNLSSPKRIFVPLCGKSLDLMWFYDGGHSVVGIECVEKAVVEFFEESGIPYVIDNLTFGSLYKSQDGRLQIYVCDFFSIDCRDLGKFDVVWDRGSFVAIYIEDREKYCRLMKDILAPDFKYLLSTIQYDGIETATGPPRCIPTDVVDAFFNDTCKQEILETMEINDDRTQNEWKVGPVIETCSLLTPKVA